MNDKTYLTAAETAALVRKALAKNFPATKFYVRSKTYSGGASIRVMYDGIISRTPSPDYGPYVTVTKPGAPLRAEVEKVVGVFGGSEFDGMTDLKYSVTHTMDEDGNVTGSKSGGSWGSVPGWDVLGAGKVVSFGADFIFVEDELPYDIRSKAA